MRPSGSSEGQTIATLLAVTECMKNTFLVITLKNTKSKEWVDVQSVKRMLHKPKNLSSDTSNAHKSQA